MAAGRQPCGLRGGKGSRTMRRGQSDAPTYSDSSVIKRAVPIRARAETSRTVKKLVACFDSVCSFSTWDAAVQLSAVEEGVLEIGHGNARSRHMIYSAATPNKGLQGCRVCQKMTDLEKMELLGFG